MEMFPAVAKNTFIQLFGRGCVVILTLLTTALLTRFFGPAGYGNYVFLTAYIMLFVALADWGTGMISVREASQAKKDEIKIFGNVLLIRSVLGLVFFILSNIVARVIPIFSHLLIPLSLGSFLILFLSVRTSLNVVFQTRLSFEKIAIVELSQSLLFLIVLFLVLPFYSNLESVFASLSLCSFVSSVVAIVLAKKMTGFDFRLDKKILYRLFWESLPTGAFLIVFSIYNRVDTIILQALKGPEAVGYYGLAYKIHDNLILIAAYLMNALFPIIAKAKGQELKKIYQEVFSLLAGLGMAVAIIVLLFAPFVVYLIAGSQFGQSVIVLRILIFATALSFVNHLTGYTLIAVGKQKISLSIAVVALVLNIGLNLILIPLLSSLGAALVTIVTEAFVLVLTSSYLALKMNFLPSLTIHKTIKDLIKTKGKIF